MKRNALLFAAVPCAIAGLFVTVGAAPAPAVRPQEPQEAAKGPLLRNLLAPVTDRTEWKTLPRELPVTVEGAAVHIAVPESGERPGPIQYWIPFGNYLKDGATFTLTFRAKSDAERIITINGQRNIKDDFANIGLNRRVTLTNEYQPFSIVFVAKNPSPDRNKLAFALGGKKGDVWISDVMLTATPDAKPDAPAPAAPSPAAKPDRPNANAATPPATIAPPPDLNAIPDFGEVTLEIAPKQANTKAPTTMTFIKIPAGTYRRGTTEAERAELQKLGLWSPVNGDEFPAKEVRISKPFLLGKYEVTQAQWMGVMGPGPRNRVNNPSAFKGKTPEENGDMPVESVSWDEAQNFLRRTNTFAGDKKLYRLPTEAEWEYAARAGSEGVFGLGADKKPITPETLVTVAWMSGNASNKTRKVGTKAPNAFGLYDMLGNVWEWCQDGYSPTAYSSLPAQDPLYFSPEITERVLRGGCWFLDKRSLRVALRGGNIPTLKNAYVGFRVVRELP